LLSFALLSWQCGRTRWRVIGSNYVYICWCMSMFYWVDFSLISDCDFIMDTSKTKTSALSLKTINITLRGFENPRRYFREKHIPQCACLCSTRAASIILDYDKHVRQAVTLGTPVSCILFFLRLCFSKINRSLLFHI